MLSRTVKIDGREWKCRALTYDEVGQCAEAEKADERKGRLEPLRCVFPQELEPGKLPMYAVKRLLAAIWTLTNGDEESEKNS